MTAYQKPQVEMPELHLLLRELLGTDVSAVSPLQGGNLGTVFAFSVRNQHYVIKFSDLAGSFHREEFIATLLTSHRIPYPRCVNRGQYRELAYIVMERISGKPWADHPPKLQQKLLPEALQLLQRMNSIAVDSTEGYGPIQADGNGAHKTWREHVIAANAEDQTGTFWEGWHSLYTTSCLEKDVYEECYQRLLAYCDYNEPYRSFLHGDYHQWNIMSDGERITGILDSNGMYGDPLVDLESLEWHMKKLDVIGEYTRLMERMNLSIPHFKERFIGAKYYKGLIGLRFYAKMGWTDAYNGLRGELLGFIK